MNLEILLAGCIGAIAPEILRLYRWRSTRGRIPKLVLSKSYFLISFAYILLGGYVASIFPGVDSPFLGVCVGCGLDTVVNTMAKIASTLVKTESEVVTRIRQSVGRPSVTLPEVDKYTEQKIVKGNFWHFTELL